jgi:2-hydroxychromene-2-carboxylate isomerase
LSATNSTHDSNSNESIRFYFSFRSPYAWLASERDHIFGVPSFVFAGKLYWGQDRMHFLRSAVIRKSP